jgi:hypothetical protein
MIMDFGIYDDYKNNKWPNVLNRQIEKIRDAHRMRVSIREFNEFMEYDCSIKYDGDTTTCGGLRLTHIKRFIKEERCPQCKVWFCGRCSQKIKKNQIEYMFCSKCNLELG